MKRTGRIGAIIKILSDNPSKIFNLNYFCHLLGAAKSSISEDLKMAKEIFDQIELGKIETVPGAKGGVRFIPWVSDAHCLEIQTNLCEKLQEQTRLLGGGFLYTSDIMFSASDTGQMALVFARKFAYSGADYVATIETKGIPLALMVARYLNIPTIVVRRETKISEGPTVSINYFSGSSNRMQKMSMAKKATVPGSKALIIDDFMRAGGSLKGISELLAEFDIEVCGIGVAIASTTPEIKKVDQYTPLLYLGEVDENAGLIQVSPNCQIFSKTTC